jgi:GAF domain-containing protein
MPASVVDVLLLTADQKFAALVGKHCPPGGVLECLSADTLEQGHQFRARQVWIDLDTVANPQIGPGPRRVYFTSQVQNRPDALPNGLYIRKPCAEVVFDVLWADSAHGAHAVVLDDQTPATRLPRWLLDFQEIRVSAFTRKLVAGLPPRLGYRHASIYLHDFERGVFTLADTTHTRVLDTMVPVSGTQQHLMSAVAHTRRTFSTAHASDELAARGIVRGSGHAYEDDVCLVAPLVSEGQVWGVLNLSGQARSPLTDDDVPLDDLLAFLGRMLHHARLFDQAQTEARVDCLTGLFNQRWMTESLDREVRRAERHHNNLALLVGVNDLVPADNLAYLLKYDTMHGRFVLESTAKPAVVSATEDSVHRQRQDHQDHAAERDPAALPWGPGRRLRPRVHRPVHQRRDAGKHLTAGAKRVVISAPTKTPDDRQDHVLQGQPREVRPRDRQGHLQRELHHQLPRPGRQGHQRQLRPRRRPDDHRPRRHRDPAHPGRPLQEGLARRPRNA